jgi:DNA replication and repair protein RecF
MFLRRLSIINFKNLEQAELEFSAGIVCFVGDNGAGKTNLVDAIHYLAMCKSAFVMTDNQSVRHDEDFFVLDGEFADDGGKKECVVCSFKGGSGKVVKRNGKQYDKLSSHIGLVPVVIISPADSLLITDAADERRRYLNSFLSQTDKSYLASLIRYNHLLGERNKLLKQDGSGSSWGELLDILDMQMAEAGEVIHATRAALIERLAPIVAEFYARLSDDREQVELTYRSELNDTAFADLLAHSREKDMINRFTTCGIHRDDMKMRIGGYPLRKYGSQGQQKSFLIALKLAQFTLVSELLGKKPILLLDDLFDKLDAGRVESLLKMVAGDDFGQIFITDCNKVRLEEILARGDIEYSLYNVNDGKLTPA